MTPPRRLPLPAGPPLAPNLPPPPRARARGCRTQTAATPCSGGGDGGAFHGGGSHGGSSGGGGSGWHGGSGEGHSGGDGGRWLTSLLSFVNVLPAMGLLSLLLPGGRGVAAGGKRGQASTQGRLLSLFVMASAAGSPALARLALWGF